MVLVAKLLHAHLFASASLVMLQIVDKPNCYEENIIYSLVEPLIDVVRFSQQYCSPIHCSHSVPCTL